MSQIIESSFIIKGRDIDAEAQFWGDSIVLKVWEKGNLISQADMTGDCYTFKRGLCGAALAAYDKAWLKGLVEEELEAINEE